MKLTLGGYTVHDKLYQGSRFIVYRGVRDMDQQKVIIKICRLENPSVSDVTILQREYQLLKQLNLTNVIHAYALLRHQNQQALVLEDIEGQTLKQMLAKNRIDLDIFFKIAIQLVDAIGELHLANIIHKDINPNNIIIEPKTYRLKITDFSISSKLSQDAQEHAEFQNLEGTLPYISPEQTGRMNRAVDYRTDFYSLGVTLYEMLTGQLPFPEDDTLELVHAHLAKMPVPLVKINPEVPAILSAIVLKLLAKVPEERYNSAAGIKVDLIKCQLQWKNDHDIKPFPLGQQDVQDRLLPSQKLYGREEQVKILLDVFEKVSKGSKELIFVSGYSGIGKTSLVKEIYKPITRQRGYFVSGKFDQLQRATPFSALAEALQELVRSFLTESEERINELKTDIMNALGQNGQLLINLIPNLSLIIGSQPEVAELPAAAAQARFTTTFKKFICALATPKHPIVLFLDDLQWIDNASLQLIQELFVDKQLQNMMLIGAYRDNEVLSDHPLVFMQEELKKSQIDYVNIMLAPLQLRDIQHLLADNLSVSIEEVIDFANLTLAKTEGNPFFINEFIKKLYHDKLLTFSYHTHQWQWDLSQIKSQDITENVVDLLISRINELSHKTRSMLQLAACIGHAFDLKTLSIILDQPLVNIVQSLQEATAQGFIIPTTDNYRLLEGEINDEVVVLAEKIRYRFSHDRVQQAAYQMMSDTVKHQVHLQIGRMLIKNKPLTRDDRRLFEVLDHLNFSWELITDPQEKLAVAEYNLWAGLRAKDSSAFAAARNYFDKGVALLANLSMPDKQSLFFELTKELALSQYLTGNFAEAEAGFSQLMREANAMLPTVEVYRLRCMMLVGMRRMPEAIELGLKALRMMGIHIPAHPKRWHVLLAILKIQWLLRSRSLQDLVLTPVMTTRVATIQGLFTQMMVASFGEGQQLLFLLICCNSLNFSIRYGANNNTSASMILYAGLILHRFGWLEESIAFHDLAFRLEQQYGLALSKGRFLSASVSMVESWYQPLEQCIETCKKSYQLSVDIGDINTTYAAIALLTFLTILLGKPISETKKIMQLSFDFYQRSHNEHMHVMVVVGYELMRRLTDNNKDILSYDELEKRMTTSEQQGESTAALTSFNSCAALISYIEENYEQAKHFGGKILAEEMSSITILKVLGIFYYALAIFAMPASSLDHANNKSLKKVHTLLKNWTSWSALNFKHYLLLFEAEMAAHANNIELAIKNYHAAIHAAQEQHILNFVAIANECAGRFYLKRNLQDYGKMHYINAYYSYQSWGAVTKCVALKKRFPYWFDDAIAPIAIEQTITNNTLSTSQVSLDVLALMKSTQAISGEIQLDKLLQKLLTILLQSAGAQRGILMVKENDQWYVEAEGSTASQQITLTRTEKVENRTDLPLSLIRYAQRTQQLVVVQSESEFANFMLEDKYLLEVKPQSTLLLPILYQGQLRSLLYLESRTTSHAFTKEHAQVLQLLATQAAISLENARLYYDATHDPLTGLANRNLLYQIFQMAASKAKRNKTLIAILFLDLDGFKHINDTMGHDIGDKLLLYVADQLRPCLREGDLAVRLGGDEFIAMLDDIKLYQVTQVAERILQKFKEPIFIQGHEIYIGSSIGISIFPNDGEDITSLLKQADISLYRVKASGKGHYQFYTKSFSQDIRDANRSELDLRSAIEKNELEVYYQPIYSAKEHQLTYFEALLRWNHPHQGIIEAKDFIKMAEKTELILPIGQWVIKKVCQQIKSWITAGYTVAPVAINVSPTQFKKQTISELLRSALDEVGIDPAYIQVEFTESIFIECSDEVLTDINAIKKMGIKIALDDFGTFYSTFSYLKRFAVDKIKINQEFVTGVASDPDDIALVKALVAMAHTLKLKVVVEGVETKEQLEILEDCQVDEIQGYYLGHPESELVVAKLLKK